MKVHLIGIGGTGMSSLAGLFVEAGHEVRGSDGPLYPPMSDQVAALGARVYTGFDPSHLEWGPDLVVIGNIAAAGNPEAKAALERGLRYQSMPQALAEHFLGERVPIVVAGTHGKTTTAALVAWLLEDAGLDPGFLVGGVLANFGRSYKLGRGRPFVIEGDEYETAFFDKGSKFLHYRPQVALLTSVEYDHAEMFPDLASLEAAFDKFVRLVPETGLLCFCGDDSGAARCAGAARARRLSYGLGAECEFRGSLASSGFDGIEFEVLDGGRTWARLRSPLHGLHNLRNALGALAAAREAGASPQALARALSCFRGVKRRQEVVGVEAGVTVLDDFAHHPTAVRETIAAVRMRWPDSPLWAIFEPRTNTTRRDVFQKEYAEAFDGADHVVVAAVDRPERAPEGRRFSPQRLVEDLRARGLRARYLPEVAAIVERVQAEAGPGDVILVMSNGSFGGIHGRLLAALRRRAPADGGRVRA
jgi:UDP-N-acetylmuramate: L-alanyl-gamma-D-glutamyl-meso-diaminopimelate ligase